MIWYVLLATCGFLLYCWVIFRLSMFIDKQRRNATDATKQYRRAIEAIENERKKVKDVPAR